MTVATMRCSVTGFSPSSSGSYMSVIVCEAMAVCWWSDGMRCLMISHMVNALVIAPPIARSSTLLAPPYT